MQPVITKKLDGLPAEMREWLLDMAAHSRRLADVVKALRERGMEVSLSTLTRWVREHREKVLLEQGEEMKGAVEALANRGQGEALRKGTLEAVRQRLYEDSLSATNSMEETRKTYAALLKEEAKLKELALAERKVALAEEKVRLQKVRLRLTARTMNGRKRVRLEVAPVVEVMRAEDVKGIEAGKGAQLEMTNREIEMTNDKIQMTKELQITNGKGGAVDGAAAIEKVKLLAGALARVEEALNRGGPADEKVVEARAVLGEERKLLEEEKG